MTIRTWLAVSFGLSFFAINGFVFCHIYNNFYQFAREQAQSVAKAQIQTFAEAIRQDLIVGSYPGLQQKAESYVALFAVQRITVEDAENRTIAEAGERVEGIEDPVFLEKEIFARNPPAMPVPDEAFGKVKMWFSFRPLVAYSMTFLERVIPLSLALMIAMLMLILILSRSLSLPLMKVRRIVSSQPLARWPEEFSHGSHIEEISFLQATLLELSTRVADAIRIESDLVKATAIARTTQMLAHDVRKPFSILRMGLGLLNNARDPTAVKKILARLVPAVDCAIRSVDGLVADIMEVGSSGSQLIRESVSPEDLIEDAISEIFRVHLESDITIDYDLRHHHQLHVHVQKVMRVFANIIGNAVQAMEEKGRIWVRTRENDGFVEFCLGNAGSLISEENLPRIFDAFFTSGKKSGTGLGLAIAQKVVTDHGGKIWCTSSRSADHPDGQVEFYFTLPIAPVQCHASSAKLPRHSSDVTNLLRISQGEPAPATAPQNFNESECSLEVEIINVTQALGRPINVLVVDDEPMYSSAIASSLARTPDLATSIQVVQATHGWEALERADSRPDLIITDVDLGAASMDGFELVRSLRRLPATRDALVCIHSNRVCAADYRTAVNQGADAFIPKPVARAQLLRLVLQAASEAAASKMGTTHISTSLARVEVLIVDDDPFILEAWEDTLKNEALVHLAESPEAVDKLLNADAGLIDRLTVVVTDLHFGNSAADGLDVGKRLKERRCTLTVLLSSDGLVDEASLEGAINRRIPKQPVSLRRLSSVEPHQRSNGTGSATAPFR